VIEAAFIDSLKVAVTLLLMDTPAAVAAGIVETTVGATSVDDVVNVHVLLAARALPATSVAPVFT
jgi:hypothetical protein